MAAVAGIPYHNYPTFHRHSTCGYLSSSAHRAFDYLSHVSFQSGKRGKHSEFPFVPSYGLASSSKMFVCPFALSFFSIRIQWLQIRNFGQWGKARPSFCLLHLAQVKSFGRFTGGLTYPILCTLHPSRFGHGRRRQNHSPIRRC